MENALACTVAAEAILHPPSSDRKTRLCAPGCLIIVCTTVLPRVGRKLGRY